MLNAAVPACAGVVQLGDAGSELRRTQLGRRNALLLLLQRRRVARQSGGEALALRIGVRLDEAGLRREGQARRRRRRL